MIFASDLDQTLIYSKRSARLESGERLPDMILVEKKEKEEISYMSPEAVRLLRQVNERMFFLPVTTRTVSQYKRISIFQEEIIPPAAVTSNGGNILINGMPDKEWNLAIAGKINEKTVPEADLQQKFAELSHEEWILSRRTADDLFHYYLINKDKAPLDELAQFKETADQCGWNMSLQGRKLYFVPKPVNKWDAVAFLKEKLGKTFVMASGDSMLDLCMLEVADFAIAPAHGELAGEKLDRIVRTKAKGIRAAEEILGKVLAVYEETSKAVK